MKSSATAAFFLLQALQGALVHGLDSTRLIYEYPKAQEVALENAVVRSNGSILMGALNGLPGIHSLNPFDGSAPVSYNLNLGGRNTTSGMVETWPDTFYFLASNFSQFGGDLDGSNAVYELTFPRSSPRWPAPNGGQPIARLVGDYPDMTNVNGMTKFNNTLLLIADSVEGRIWGVNTVTGAHSVISSDKALAPDPSLGGFPYGVNGIHFYDGVVYFTNTQVRSFGAITLNSNAQQVGSADIIAYDIIEDGVKPGWDDFALSANASFAYCATQGGNTIQQVNIETGDVTIIAGNINSTAIADPTAAVFGRTSSDKNTLYVLTTGGLDVPVQDNGPQRVGAQIVAVPISNSGF